MKLIYKIFRWNIKEMLQAIFAVFIFSLSIKVFIEPNNLYNGGVLGLSQLLNSVLKSTIGNSYINLTSIFYYAINIPLFLIAFKRISKNFFARTLFAVTLQTIFLNVIPTLNAPIVEDLLTNVLIGGIVDGIGLGILLSTGASSGGTDILGVALANKSRKLSVGSIGLFINVFIYSISGVLYGVEIMIYSIILSAIASFMLDHTHKQNICSTAFVFTKNKPNKIIDYIKNDLNRDATYWEAKGGYDNSKTYITYAVLSKYELIVLDRHINDLDENAFLVKNDGIKIHGNFKKKI